MVTKSGNANKSLDQIGSDDVAVDQPQSGCGLGQSAPSIGLEEQPVTERTDRRPDAVVLLGRGGYGTPPQEELDRMIAAIRATGRYRLVQGAFLDRGMPSLPAAMQACIDAGARRILVAPVFVPVDRTLRIWLPEITRRWLRHRKGPEIEIVLADALGDSPALGEAVVEVVTAAEGRDDVRVNAPVDRGNPEWSVIPPHRYHVLLCHGPRCMTAGAGELWQHLTERLAEHGLDTGPKQVHIAKTGCLYPCNRGPVMIVYPDGVWYCHLTEQVIDRIVDEHFVNGQCVEKYARRPLARQS